MGRRKAVRGKVRSRIESRILSAGTRACLEMRHVPIPRPDFMNMIDGLPLARPRLLCNRWGAESLGGIFAVNLRAAAPPRFAKQTRPPRDNERSLSALHLRGFA